MTNDEYLLASNQGILIALAREGHINKVVIGLIEANYKSRGIENSEFILDLKKARVAFLDEQLKNPEQLLDIRKYVNSILSGF